MRNQQRNRIERFRTIAKRLVDRHSAELFTVYNIQAQNDVFDAYNDHLDSLGRELDREANDFITTYKTQSELMRAEIWRTCTRYLDLFVKRNQPV